MPTTESSHKRQLHISSPDVLTEIEKQSMHRVHLQCLKWTGADWWLIGPPVLCWTSLSLMLEPNHREWNLQILKLPPGRLWTSWCRNNNVHAATSKWAGPETRLAWVPPLAESSNTPWKVWLHFLRSLFCLLSCRPHQNMIPLDPDQERHRE